MFGWWAWLLGLRSFTDKSLRGEQLPATWARYYGGVRPSIYIHVRTTRAGTRYQQLARRRAVSAVSERSQGGRRKLEGSLRDQRRRSSGKRLPRPANCAAKWRRGVVVH